MFRNLIIVLQDRYHLVAPAYSGFGYSATPSVNKFDYTFEHLTKIMEVFAVAKGLRNYNIYLFK